MRPVSPYIGTLPTGRELSVPNVFAMKETAAGHLSFKYSITPVPRSEEDFLPRYAPTIGKPTEGDVPQSNDPPQ